MRELLLRQTAVDELIAAQQAAVAGIGLRGADAREAMKKARRKALQRRADERWAWIVAHAKHTRFEEMREGEVIE